MFFAASLLALASAIPNGAHVPDQSACYTLSYGNPGETPKPIGVTWQKVKHTVLDGQAILFVSVHQHLADGTFDMQDNYILNPKDLQPLAFNSSKDGKNHVTLDYQNGRVQGQRITKDGVPEKIDVATGPQVWEGNLFGVLFGALPLETGGSYRLPFYQYDKGLGEFTINVTGTEQVQTPSGVVKAWVLDAGQDSDLRTEYLIDQSNGRELGYRANGYVQKLGGDCSAIAF